MKRKKKISETSKGSEAAAATLAALLAALPTCIQLARQIFLRLIGMKQSIHLFIYRCADGPQYDYIFSMFDKCGDFDCFHFRYLRNARNIFKSNFER